MIDPCQNLSKEHHTLAKSETTALPTVAVIHRPGKLQAASEPLPFDPLVPLGTAFPHERFAFASYKQEVYLFFTGMNREQLRT
jgi:hypothetical protein